MSNSISYNASIWENFKAGDKEAFALLYNQHVQTLFHYGTKISPEEELVKDAIQEIFIDLYLKRKNNNADPQNLKFYLILALKRNLIKKLKRNRKQINETSRLEFIFEPEYCIEKTIIEEEENKEQKIRIGQALSQLPPKQKEALYLRFNESLDYPDIAQLMEISIESARKQVYRALKYLREHFNNQSFILLMLFHQWIFRFQQSGHPTFINHRNWMT